MGLYFDREETLRGYYEMMWQILGKYGIPEALYGDNRTIFEYRKLSEKNQTIDRDVHVNFKRMCMQLGIELITTDKGKTFFTVSGNIVFTIFGYASLKSSSFPFILYDGPMICTTLQ